ncbi:hypothetical protein GCM10023322_42080 [Rugosimonospora acidiphila]|uniref:Cell envelope-related transcriptional attenuator domain-containing protein n=1 Tax=Rugosimonospora acidiphila TaxID=556531 RepID=A0ABP9S156_9ACTN
MEYASGAVLDSSGDDRSSGDRRRTPGRRGGGPPRKGGRGGRGKNGGRKRKDPLWAKLLVGFGALLMLSSGGLIFGSKVILAAATKSVTQQDLLGAASGKDRAHATISGAKNILLIGVDNRPGQNPNDLVRSDSIIILHITASHDVGYMVSIPRDTEVSIPAYNNGKHSYAGGRDKINAAFAFGSQGLTGNAARQNGVELLEKTIQGLPGMAGMTFDAGAIVDFTGFQQVVNVLGGVTMYVDETTTSIHVGFTSNGTEKMPERIDPGTGELLGPVPGVTPEVYTKGTHHLSAWQALDYVRQRDKLANGDGDYGRQRHQQQFIKALFKEILSSDTLTNPSKLNKVLDTVGQAMTIDTGGVKLTDWIFAMRNISADSLVTIKTNDGQYDNGEENGSSVQLLSDTSMQLLQCVKDDNVGTFVQLHPDWVAAS